MPQETLSFPPLYCLVGAYRLLHDPSLYKPMWAKCSSAAKQAGILSLVWAIFTWPIQRLFVYYFMSASASVTGFGAIYNKLVQTADVTDDNLPFRIPVPSLQTFATLMFVMGQIHAIMEFWLRRKLRECRNTAYTQTVKSRGKAADWWTEYTEEFSNPPTEKAIKHAKKQGWYMKLASPLSRFVILKVFLLPVDFVPFFGMALGAALRSLTYGRMLHKSFFEAKRMSPLQIELWITERQNAYRSFGFTAALMERIPLIGLVFSVSNQIGAAMWAHDLEKRQQRFKSLSSSNSSNQGVRERVELEQYKSKPTIKKLYNQVRDDQFQPQPNQGGSEGEGEKGEGSHIPSSSADFASFSLQPSNLTNGGRGRGEEKGGSFHGQGQAILRCSREGERRTAVFTHLSFTFPLKLISPITSARNATFDLLKSSSRSSPTDGVGKGGWKTPGVLYIVGYGGGLVSGDSVDLDVDVGIGCSLVVLTQGSTKVFKTRNTKPTRGIGTSTFTHSSAGEKIGDRKKEQTGEQVKEGEGVRQSFRFLIRPFSTLILLPEPVTCFANSRYDQIQRFDIRDRQTSSLVMLDWITPGRTCSTPLSLDSSFSKLNHLDAHPYTPSPYTSEPKQMKNYSTPPRDPEWWAFDFYRSRNEVRTSPPTQLVARDVLLLSQKSQDTVIDPNTGLKLTDLARRNHPYGCYATLILVGPDAEPIIKVLTEEFGEIQQRPTTKLSEEVLWSLTNTEERATMVRIAAKDTQTVRKWLFERLTSLERVIGRDLFRQALGS